MNGHIGIYNIKPYGWKWNFKITWFSDWSKWFWLSFSFWRLNWQYTRKIEYGWEEWSVKQLRERASYAICVIFCRYFEWLLMVDGRWCLWLVSCTIFSPNDCFGFWCWCVCCHCRCSSWFSHLRSSWAVSHCSFVYLSFKSKEICYWFFFYCVIFCMDAEGCARERERER